MKNKIYCRILACAVLGATIPALYAQTVRTAYFMDKSVVRTSLNPAFQPERNYYSIPLLGSLGVSFGSNGMVLSDLLYPTKDGKLHTFMSPDAVTPAAFLKKVKDQNNFDVNIQTDIFTAGWRMFDGFCTVGVAFKTGTSFRVPKSLFEFMKEANGSYDIRDLQADVRSYVELSGGYSRSLDERLTIGGKLKLLPAFAGVRLNFKRLQVDMTASDKWTATSEAELYSAGLELTNEEGEISDINYSFGLAGFGAGVDLGASYKLLDNLTVSASVLDLGFISWSKATYAEARGNNFEFTGFDLNEGASTNDEVEKMKDDLQGLARFDKGKKEKGYTSFLATAALAGAEYTFFENRLGAGLLSSTRFNPYGVYTELTASANYRPVRWFAATLSYSALHSNFKTYGVAVNFAPKGFNFFLGSDYMLTKVTPQYVPVSANAANLYLGMSVWL